MPSSASSQNNYYASHHRRGSQLSLSSTGEHTDASKQQQPSDQPLLYLPSLTYNQPTTNRDPPVSNSHPRETTFQGILQFDGQHSPTDVSKDSGTFHAQRQSPFPELSNPLQNGSAHLNSRSTGTQGDRTSQRRGSSFEASKSTPSLSSTLRSRTSSIKDLVARFDGSPNEEVPPIPSRPESRVTSRAKTPVINNPMLVNARQRPFRLNGQESEDIDQYSAMPIRKVRTSSTNQLPGPQQPGRRSIEPLMTNVTASYAASTSQSAPSYRKPLFGEVLPQKLGLTNPGYGIHGARRRRGSEGSPMHSPNPMFSTTETLDPSPISPTAWYRDASTPTSVTNTSNLHSSALTSHRRTQSDLPETQINRHLPTSAYKLSLLGQSSHFNDMSGPSSSSRALHSRIPVGRRPTSSDSGQSSPSSRAPSTLEKYPIISGTAQSIPRVVGPSTPQRSSSKRKVRTANKIETPARRGQTSAPQNEKSTSLRANIIAPPPIISPPLRSSRPRQAVSSASTAASRAKMAEKFELQQRKNSERGDTARRQMKPRELTNIDLEARRKNITQALDKLRRSQVIKPVSVSTQRRNRRLATTESVEDLTSPDTPSGPKVPEVVIGNSYRKEGEHGNFKTSEEHYNPPGAFPPDDEAYPVESESQGLRLDITPSMVNREPEASGKSQTRLQLSPLDTEDEPNSAVTVGTEATIIDAEPQALTRPKSPRPTVLSQVMGMRQPSPLTPASATSTSCSESVADLSDHADTESVHIMLRNTQYMEDSPAIGPNYHDQLSLNNFSDLSPMPNIDRNSWTSSIPDNSSDYDRLEVIAEASPDPRRSRDVTIDELAPSFQDPQKPANRRDVETLDSIRSTMASDAYTVVNFVLRRQTETGYVERGAVDDMVQRVFEHSPQLMYQDTFDQDRIEQLTLEELRKKHNDGEYTNNRRFDHGEDGDSPTIGVGYGQDYRQHEDLTTDREHCPVFDNGHSQLMRSGSYTPRQSSQPILRQSVSTDGDRDFVTEYPPVGAESYVELPNNLDGEAEYHRQKQGRVDVHPHIDTDLRSYSDDETRQGLGLSMRVTSPVSTPWEVETNRRPPSHSPPPLPELPAKSYEDTTAGFAQSDEDHTPMILTPRGLPPQIPRRMTSHSQIAAQQYEYRASSLSPSIKTNATSITAVETDSRQSEEQAETLSDEKKRLKQRGHVIRELIDTEMTFERDMKVVVDIYQATAEPIVSKEDIQTIFGNSEQVVQFSKNFGTQLKKAGKPVYSKPRNDPSSGTKSALERSGSFASLHEKDNSTDTKLTDDEKDRLTHIGDVFLAYAANMELVYKEYLIKHDTANNKMQRILQTQAGKEWTRLCHIESRDLTSAWDLNSLLVKPVQRVLKYPLFLKDLLKSTPENHPDYVSLKKALDLLTDAITRINESKKHNERIQEVIGGRKRKESDARTGISKAIGRQKEKFKQNVGLSELYEDVEYTTLYKRFDEHIVFMVVALQDQTSFEMAMNKWVGNISGIAEVADKMCDVQATRNTVAEAKLRGFVMTVQRVRRVGLPSLLSDVDRLVFEPIRQAHKQILEFKEDPKGLLQKRDKRVVDYARYRSMKERNEKLDKKSIERMEQWEALNREAKTRVTKLIDLSRQVVFLHLLRFNNLYAPWIQLCMRQMAEAMSVDSSDTDQYNLERDYSDEFEPTLAAVLGLNITNAVWLKENGIVPQVFSPPSAWNGVDSPRQTSSAWSANKRSISLNSEGSHQVFPENFKRNSGTFTASPMVDSGSTNSLSGLGSSRLRASSAASGPNPGSPDFHNGRNMTLPPTGAASTSPQPRPGTSPGLMTENLPAFAPRVSLEAQDQFFGTLRPGSLADRPASSSTFHSALGAPGHAVPGQAGGGGGSSIFSSAMPMSDSPMSTRGPSFELPQLEYDANSRVLFTAASVYEFNIDAGRSEGGWPYLNYVAGEIFDVLGEKGELWLSKNQDDRDGRIGWIWNKHFAKLEM